MFGEFFFALSTVKITQRTVFGGKGLVARTDPENPMSPRQEYKLA